MTLHELRPGVSPLPEPVDNIAVLPQRRERLAIVSSRNKLCGIAAYTQALEHHLADVLDVRVFDLDQYLLRGQHPRVRRLGDNHIKEICREISSFDVVNVQLEHGTLGRSAKDICRRLSWIVGAAPRLSLTFHTFKRPPVFPLVDFTRSILTRKWRTACDIAAAHSRERKLSLTIAGMLRRAQRRKPVSVIVHNRRDLSDARFLLGFDRVFDHPLTFLSTAETELTHAQATRRRFGLLDPLASDVKLIGAFGFINDYKGLKTIIYALNHLPSDYHLLIFGGVHPNEIASHQAIHPYLASLLDAAKVDSPLYDQLRQSNNIGLSLDIERHFAKLFGAHPRDLSNRVHFMGALDDSDFRAGMVLCDVVVFPYLEVGQSASGPISQAVELGCRIIASRTRTFLEFAAYHPQTIEFFDIGNQLELAERIAARPQYLARGERPHFNVETNKAVYLAANSAPTATVSGFWRRRHRFEPAEKAISAAR